MRKMLMVVVLVLVCSFASLAYGELVLRGNGMVYDTDFNITWYSIPNTNRSGWCEKMAWAASLNVSGITGWRLPSALNLDGTGPFEGPSKMSEMGHLFYTEMGIRSGTNTGDPNVPGSFGIFTEASGEMFWWFYMWTSTQYEANPLYAWMFNGDAWATSKINPYPIVGWGLAVHDGDVANLSGVVLPPLPVAWGCPGQPQVAVTPPVVTPPPVVEPVVCPAPVICLVCPEMTTPTPTPVVEPVCPVCPVVVTPIPIPVVKPSFVGIDVKQNLINPQSRGKIQVAILSSKTFHAPTMVDIGSLTFGRTGSEDSLAFCQRNSKDVNRDKYPDLVCEFNTTVMDFHCGDIVGFLMGNTIQGMPFEGKDAVKINCPTKGKK